MIHRDDLISLIENYFGKDLLQTAKQKDKYLANGIQILGKEKVEKIVVGVSATVALFEEAKKRHADVVLTKHPMMIAPVNQILDPSLQARLRMVFAENWTVGGYHYALDVHPIVGNTPILMEKLGIERLQPFYDTWGYVGEFAKPTSAGEVAEFLEKIVNHPVMTILPAKPRPIKRIGIVTGGAIPHIDQVMEMLELRLDAYITGEIAEWTTHLFQEVGIAYFAAGHHATEVFGPQKFAEVLQKLVGKKANVEFVHVWNEV